MTTPFKIALLAALFLAVLFIGLKSCKPDTVHPSPAQAITEQRLMELLDKKDRERYAEDSIRNKTILKAIDERLKGQTVENTKATEKAVNSALQYAQNRTPENCHHALTDCQHENQAKAAVIGTQQEKISSLARTVKSDSAEINRQRMAIGLYNDNLKRANENWQADRELLEKARKPKSWGIGLNAGYGATEHGLTPYIGIGISRNIIRF